MKSAELAPDTDPEAPFELASLSPELTGLPMIVWVSERGRARYDVRVEVSLVHGRPGSLDRAVSVSVRTPVDVVAGSGLADRDLALVQQWIEVNRDAIIAYWDNELSTLQLLRQLQAVA